MDLTDESGGLNKGQNFFLLLSVADLCLLQDLPRTDEKQMLRLLSRGRTMTEIRYLCLLDCAGEVIS